MYHINKLFVFGVFCVVSAIIFFAPDFFTKEEALTAFSGTVASSSITIEDVSSEGKYGYEAESKKAVLTFNLAEHQKIFQLSENIGNSDSSEKYSRLSEHLNHSKSVTILAKEFPGREFFPSVYQIDVDGQTVLSFEEVQSNNLPVFIFLNVLGIICIYLAIKKKKSFQRA